MILEVGITYSEISLYVTIKYVGIIVKCKKIIKYIHMRNLE